MSSTDLEVLRLKKTTFETLQDGHRMNLNNRLDIWLSPTGASLVIELRNAVMEMVNKAEDDETRKLMSKLWASCVDMLVVTLTYHRCERVINQIKDEIAKAEAQRS